MHIGQIITADCANGTGIRVSVFVSGCTNRCKGCFQPETWDFNYGHPYDEAAETFILSELSKSYYDGLTILGGEPFEMENQKEVLRLIRRVRKELPSKNIWMYTGFIYDRDLIEGGCRYCDDTDEILEHIDVLVDGPFIEEQKDLSLKFRGSRNQRVIDMRNTRQENGIILYCT